jgi:hypothetical protein
MAYLRNFWLEGKIDGRSTNVSGGPKRKDGGMSFTLYQKDRGDSTVALEVICRHNHDGSLTTSVYMPGENSRKLITYADKPPTTIIKLKKDYNKRCCLQAYETMKKYKELMTAEEWKEVIDTILCDQL